MTHLSPHALFRREPLADAVPRLVATARGEMPATLVIRNGRLVNVCSGEILPGMSIAVQGSRIAYVGPDCNPMIGGETKVIDADGAYIAPGLLDGHCHIESSQMTLTQFARAVLPMGTTGIFYDAHEMANVFGLKGLRWMLEEGRQTPLAAYMQVASCVPASSPELETSGAVIGPAEIQEAMNWGEDVIALGEVMNFPGVVLGDPLMMAEIGTVIRAGRVVDGHFTWPADDWRIVAYAAAGVTGDHEVTTMGDVIARIRLGMYAMMRRGSAWHDVAETIRAFSEKKIDPRRMMLVTDDRHAESLVDEGHMNFVVRHAIQQGVPPVTAFQMATLNTAERFGVARDVGSIIPASYADIILLEGNLADVNVALTVAAGTVVAERGKLTVDLPPFTYPEEAHSSVRLPRELKGEDFVISAPLQEGEIKARAIRIIENHVETKEIFVSVPVVDGRLKTGGSRDLCKVFVIERHKGTGNKAAALLSGLGLERPVALAMTVAHDSHNLLVLGNDDEMMAKAGNRVKEMGGGVAVVTEQGIEALPLPIAGLMSDGPYESVAEQSRAVSHALKEAGCHLNYALMTLSLLTLVVIPELRISDKGLVKVTPEGFRFVSLFV